MKKGLLLLLFTTFIACYACSQAEEKVESLPTVYFTEEISPESLIAIFDALGVEPVGNVCVKISTGEGGNTHYLKPALIGDLVKKINGTLVECGTAYGGTRQDPAKHWETIREHGFLDIAKVDLMDEFGDMKIPVRDTTHIKYDIVGEHLKDYDFMVNLAHFKGHAMGGYGGVLKNASIGVASTNGKAYIHSAGKQETADGLWANIPPQDLFIESMGAAAQAVHDYMNAKADDGKPRVVYINIMNNMSVDCDCSSHPAAPLMKDMGIAASLDPVAVDQACLDMVFRHVSTEGDDSAPMIERITTRHGEYLPPYSEKIGLGSTKYNLVNIKKQ
ncbi:MAG: DUF362 domain-containing protein [Muribaculaceae bacterium]|nr:DUF362 domain-containing protein [Muribaculaceae bacterium]